MILPFFQVTQRPLVGPQLGCGPHFGNHTTFLDRIIIINQEAQIFLRFPREFAMFLPSLFLNKILIVVCSQCVLLVSGTTTGFFPVTMMDCTRIQSVSKE